MSEQPDISPRPGLIRRFLNLPTDSVPKTVAVAVTLCLVASMVVSAAAVTLRPVQEANALRNKLVNILQVAGVYDPEVDVLEASKPSRRMSLTSTPAPSPTALTLRPSTMPPPPRTPKPLSR